MYSPNKEQVLKKIGVYQNLHSMYKGVIRSYGLDKSGVASFTIKEKKIGID